MSAPQRHGVEDWSAYLTTAAPDVTTPPVAACHRCGTARVPDDELGIFQLCPRCSRATLRPKGEGQ